MTQVIQGLTGGGGAAKRAAAAAAEQNRIAAARQQQTQENQAATTGTTLSALTRTPRGQRLLLGSDRGGLAATLGGGAAS